MLHRQIPKWQRFLQQHFWDKNCRYINIAASKTETSPDSFIPHTAIQSYILEEIKDDKIELSVLTESVLCIRGHYS